MHHSSFFLSLLALACHRRRQSSPATCHALSIADRAQTSRSRLSEAFRSPSKKLTLHPELLLPEPTDPTALLLRSSEVTKLSEVVRTRAKANAAFVAGTTDAFRPMGTEQENSRGNFPGPVPLVYCLTQRQYDGLSGGDEDDVEDLLTEVADAGADGVLVPFFGGDGITAASVDGQSVEAARKCCEAILNAGMQPIPEIVLANGEKSDDWSEEALVKLVDAVKDACGGEDPVSVMLTAAEAAADDDEEGEASAEEGGDGGAEEIPSGVVPILTIPPALGKRLAFLGSVRAAAGEGRMGAAASLLKDAGFHGAFLRADCVPGYRMNPDLGVVGGFWAAAMGDLKSLKSKSFSFRSKVKLEKDVPMEWYNYQKDIMDSGALGGANHASPGLDSSSGDFQGF